MLFAEREYSIKDSESKIILQIYEPCLVDGDWVCRHKVIRSDHSFVDTSDTLGADKLQSFTLALRRISVDLECLSQDIGAQITWMGDTRLDLI